MSLRHIIPALAAVGYAAASCSVAATTTIQSGGDASALASCSTFSGSIAIATGTTDSIALDGVQKISGNLVANNVDGLTSLSANDLQAVTGTFDLEDCTTLSTLNFPELATVGTIRWIGLAQLESLAFTTSVQMAKTVYIENTMLNSLEGIDLQTADTITLTENKYLNEISMQLGNLTGQFTISANGRQVELSLPNLIWANGLNIQNASKINLDSLAAINGTLGFYSNLVESISCPNLTTIGKTLAINANAMLSNVTMPELKTITGGLQVQNNTKYEQMSFPNVQTVGGAIDLYGTFTSVSLPKLQDVRGGFNLQSTNDITSSCNHFHGEAGQNNVIQGQYACLGKTSHPGGTGTVQSGTNSGDGGSSSSSPTSSKSSADAVFISGATGLLGVAAAMFGML